MKKSINRLPKRTQQELTILVELITQTIKGCVMIILYGSYAKGKHVFWDERIEFGTHTIFQSDLDILVVISKCNMNTVEVQLDNKVTSKYNRIFDKQRPTSRNSNVIRYAPPEFIIEYIDNLNKELEMSRYFLTDVVKEGILLYDNKDYKLAKPRTLLFNEIKDIAIQEYDIKFNIGNDRLDIGYYLLKKEKYTTGSFDIHQACERYYNAIDLVFSNYSKKSHDLKKLLRRIKKHSRDLVSVFPLNTEFEKRCYTLLCKAYIEARYNSKFVVTKEEFEYMIERVEILKSITEKICTEKITSYDSMIETD